MSKGQSAAAGRLAFIDWTRGLAALVMLQGHVFHSFTRTDLRDQGPYMLSQFLGGVPPAVFLFLTGITFAFLMHGQEKQELSAWQRILGALKRSRYLFLIAFLFRIQLYVFGFPTSPASEILKVDVLNCMGLAMLIMAPMAVFTTRERIRLCTILGLVIAGLAPLVTMTDSASVPWLIRSYFYPSLNYFGFFPWAAFLAFGMAVGSVLRVIQREDMSRTMMWMLGVGLSLILAARFFGDLPYSFYPKSDYWLNSPCLILIKLGVVLTILAMAYLWMQANVESPRWSLLRLFGTHSLLVYWVHIEIVYGRWFGIWKESLSVGQVLLFTLALVALMAILSMLRTRWTIPPWRSWSAWLKPGPVTVARRYSGD